MRKHRFYLIAIAAFIVVGIALQHPTPSQAQTDSQAKAQAQAGRDSALAATRLGAASVSGSLDGSGSTTPNTPNTGNGISVAMVAMHDASLVPATTPSAAGPTAVAGPAGPAGPAGANGAPAPSTTATSVPAMTQPTAPLSPLAAIAAAAAPVTPPAYTPLGGIWLKLRMCESRDNYLDDTGNGYYGAYQFSPITWKALGFPGLPSNATPAVQDHAAQVLQARSGWGQWPSCSRQLGLL